MPTRRDFIDKHETIIRTAHKFLLDSIPAGENRPDLGVMEDVFCNNCRLGQISRGDDPEIRAAALYAVTGTADLGNAKALAVGDAYFSLKHEEYNQIED